MTHNGPVGGRGGDTCGDIVLDASLGKLNAKDFAILKVLGCGAFGKVYLVKRNNDTSNKVFAMKSLKKQLVLKKEKNREHLITERKVLEKVRTSPFLTQLHYAFQNSERLFLVMDFVPGGEIFSLLLEKGKFTVPETKFYCSELIIALEALHSLGIIYRDLKLENVLLDEEGHVILTDFGLSKDFDGDEHWTYSYCGTVEYMSPEVIQHGKKYSFECDWWSFGVFTYELLTGTSPFTLAGKDNSQSAVADRVLKGKYPKLPSLFPIDAIHFVEELIVVNPEKRLGYAGAEAVKQHAFFKNTDWDDVKNKSYTPPNVPNLRGMADVSKFASEFTQQDALLSPLLDPKLDPNMFSGFSYNPKMVSQVENFEFELERLKQLSLSSEHSAFFREYSVDFSHPPLGRGAYSTVRACVRKSDSAEFAVKIIKKVIRCTDEVEILKQCQKHPGVVQLVEIYYDRIFCYIVTEKLTGGELITRIKKQKTFTEAEAAKTFKELVDILYHLHSNNIVHRDVKPENLVYSDKSESARIKLIDFGFAKRFHSKIPLLTPCFTESYAAPEVKKGLQYDPSCDLWSLGMVLYLMLTGHLPYQTQEYNEILEDIKGEHVAVESPEWSCVSETARNLVTGLLTVKPENRHTLEKVRDHPWLTASSIPDTPLATPGNVDLSLSAKFNRISSVFRKADAEGCFRLQDVNNAPLAKRRRKKGRNESEGSGDEHTMSMSSNYDNLSASGGTSSSDFTASSGGESSSKRPDSLDLMF